MTTFIYHMVFPVSRNHNHLQVYSANNNHCESTPTTIITSLSLYIYIICVQSYLLFTTIAYTDIYQSQYSLHLSILIVFPRTSTVFQRLPRQSKLRYNTSNFNGYIITYYIEMKSHYINCIETITV